MARDGGRGEYRSADRSDDGGLRDATTVPDGSTKAQTYALTVTAVDTTFVTEDHFIAAVEMQLSGEPFAEAMGRDLGGYSRDYACQDAACQASIYTDPSSADGGSVIDLPGYVGGRVVRVLEAADEQHRLRVGRRDLAAVRAGAQPDRRHRHRRARAGADLVHAHGRRQQRLRLRDGAAGRAIRSAGRGSGRCSSRSSRGTRRSRPRNSAATCQLTSDDNPGKHAALYSDDYECDYTTLNLPNRDAQVTKTIGPGRRGGPTGKRRSGRSTTCR